MHRIRMTFKGKYRCDADVPPKHTDNTVRAYAEFLSWQLQKPITASSIKVYSRKTNDPLEQMELLTGDAE